MRIKLIITYFALAVLIGCSCKAKTPQLVKQTEMSDNILKIIPTNPSFIPSQSWQDNAKALLVKFYNEKQISFLVTDSIEFVDQGEKFESVSCNLCGQVVEIEDWQNAMDKAYEKHFEDLSYATQCCHKTSSLNDLNYKSPAGFAKFIINISEAENELTENSLEDLEEILRTPLRRVWAHY